MQVVIESTYPAAQRRRWVYAHASVWLAALSVFLLLPWSLEVKALAVLHGLCAQQPDHSFYFGAARLPFDARMTGIYGGFITTTGTLLVLRRWRAGGLPPLWIGVVFVGFVGLMGLDGLNSTLLDFGYWHLYQPHNLFRLATGLLAGSSLAAFVWLMIVQVGFAPHARHHRPAIGGARDLAVLILSLAAWAGMVYSGWGPLRVPLSLVLIVAAVLVLAGLAMSFVLLLTRADGRAISTYDLAMPATIALLVALLIVGVMSGGRFALEAWLGIPDAIGGIQ